MVPDGKKDFVMPKAMIRNDEHASYDGLRWMGQNYKHKTVNHSESHVNEYAHAIYDRWLAV